MPYINAWVETDPLGSEPAANIDNIIRTTKVSLRERIADLLGITDFALDPLVATSLKLNRTAAAKILGGTGSTSLRNSADSADNILIQDNGEANFRGQYYSGVHTLTDGATIALDWNDGNVQKVTLAGNRTFTFANPKGGARYVIILTQDATGSRTITWPTIKWSGGAAPTLTATANKKDVISIFYDGTDYLGASSLNF